MLSIVSRWPRYRWWLQFMKVYLNTFAWKIGILRFCMHMHDRQDTVDHTYIPICWGSDIFSGGRCMSARFARLIPHLKVGAQKWTAFARNEVRWDTMTSEKRDFMRTGFRPSWMIPKRPEAKSGGRRCCHRGFALKAIICEMRMCTYDISTLPLPTRCSHNRSVECPESR